MFEKTDFSTEPLSKDLLMILRYSKDPNNKIGITGTRECLSALYCENISLSDIFKIFIRAYTELTRDKRFKLGKDLPTKLHNLIVNSILITRLNNPRDDWHTSIAPKDVFEEMFCSMFSDFKSADIAWCSKEIESENGTLAFQVTEDLHIEEIELVEIK